MAAIYGLCDPVSGELRYIGKANDPQKRLKSHMRDCRHRATPVYCWIRSLDERPALVVLEADCLDWKEAERRWIAKARAEGVRLLNLADGGDEPGCSLEVRRRNAERLNGKTSDNAGLRAYKEMMRRIGFAMHDMQKAGRLEKAARLRDVADMLRGFTSARKSKVGLMWMQRNPSWAEGVGLA